MDPYDPPLVEVDTSHLPAGEHLEPSPEGGNRRLALVVIALAAVLGIGGVVLLVQLWPSGAATPSAAAIPAAASPAPEASPAPSASVDPDDVGTWPDLRALPADLGSSLRSVEDGADTRIGFVNDGDETVTLSWIDDEGEQSPYASVEPGQTYVQKTFAGHFWVASGPDETVIAVFQATDQPGRALLR
ncbi:von Hippel-Lindau disease tumour suppressor protein [Actinoplanes derwentensis]|uniref:von Hippel-Lindau disease tumour suppressor protein n=1 Tax=Actinoplanes derwentensis TaxID=113562 RepID=A0A1H1SDM0_9ACTN|nr:von Hippel-Lindau disease tumour suppressor protein [Actinoplanes derwentensis]